MSAELAVINQVLNKTEWDVIFISDYVNGYYLSSRTTVGNSLGTGTFTLPDGYNDWIKISLIGGGGGGGGGGTSQGSGGGGGSPGGYLDVSFFLYTGSISYGVGTPGSAGSAGSGSGASGGNGGNGGNTWFVNSSSGYISLGGMGGRGGGKSGGGFVSGGAGGDFTLGKINGFNTATIAGGAAATAGNPGNNGSTLYFGEKIFGAGGSGGTFGKIGGNRTTATGSVGAGSGGGGGDSPWSIGGVGGAGGVRTSSPLPQAGSPPVGYGGGGGGGGGDFSGTLAGAGGIGTSGLIVIYGFRR